MTTVSLPAYAYEEQLPELLERLGVADSDAEIALDFKPVSFWTPGALALVLAKVQHWRGQGKRAVLRNCKECSAFGYLQRINFFAHVGVQLPESFRRRDARRRFVELRRIGGKGPASVGELSTDVAQCVFPDANVDDPEESGLFDLLQYAVSELATNVLQHAKAPGFAMAQYTGQTDLVRVAIADSGIGILRSFQETGSPHWKPELTDADAIALALQPKVSSKSHLSTPWGESINAGVGLTLLKELCVIAGGQFFMASGNGVCSQPTGSGVLQQTALRTRFQGTVCVLVFRRAQIKNFAELLHRAKQATGLLPRGQELGKYFA